MMGEDSRKKAVRISGKPGAAMTGAPVWQDQDHPGYRNRTKVRGAMSIAGKADDTSARGRA